MDPLSRFVSWLLRLLVGGVYKRFLSPILHAFGGPLAGCRYEPSCSSYFLQAIQIHGPWKGGWMGLKRLMRCHPWGGEGLDPVPPRGDCSRHSRPHGPQSAH